jgi:hypothetical protein
MLEQDTQLIDKTNTNNQEQSVQKLNDVKIKINRKRSSQLVVNFTAEH